MEAPDGATVYARVVEPAGTTLARAFADNAMASALANSAHASFASGSGWKQQATALSAGLFEIFVQVQTADTEQEMTLEIGWLENSAANQVARRYRVGDAADTDTIDTNVSDVLTRFGVASDAAAASSSSGSLRAITRRLLDTILGVPADVGLTTLTALIGAGSDAAGASGTAGQSLQAKLRKVIDDVVLLLADTGDGTDAATAAGIAGSIHSKLRQLLVDTAALLVDTGDGADAATAGGAVGSLHSKLRRLITDVGTPTELTTLVGMLGVGSDAAGTVGTAGQSFHAKLRKIMADIDLLEEDIGDISAFANLRDLKSYLGTLLDTANVPLADLLGLTAYQLYKVASVNTVSDTFVVTQVTGGAVPPTSDNFYKGAFGVFLTGTMKGKLFQVATYTGGTATLGYLVASGDPANNDILALVPNRNALNIGASDDAAAGSLGAADTGLHAVLRRVGGTLIGDPTGGPASFQTLAQLLGFPNNAAADPDSVNGSLFAYLKHVNAHIHTIEAAAGTQKGTFTQYAVNKDAVIAGDPTDGEVNATGTATDAGATPPYEVMHVVSLTFPETTEAAIVDIFATLKFTSQITTGAGTGSIKMMLSPVGTTETVGSAPSGSAVDITDVLSASTTKTTHNRSGRVRSTAIPATNGVKLLLVGKCATANDVLTATLFESTKLEVTYGRS